MDFSEEMTDEILKIFQIESDEIISKINNSLLDLEKKPNNKDAILSLFRDAHTLKGASRMVGFNSVQTVAHKMEDVLGLAKENKITLNSNIVNILYKTVDFLSELIQKSLQKGQDVYTEDIPNQISTLENIESLTNEAKDEEDQNDFDKEFFMQSAQEINSLIPQTLTLLMKIEGRRGEGLIAELLQVTNSLYDIFNNIGIYDIKKSIEDIKVKLEFIIKASNSLTIDETEEIHKVIDSVINKLSSLYELYNFELIDYYSVAFDEISKKATEEPQRAKTDENKIIKQINVSPFEITKEISQQESAEKADITVDLDYIQYKISDLPQNTVSIKEIKKLIDDYQKNCTDIKVKSILDKITQIFEFVSVNEIQFNEETLSVIKQSIEHCDNIIKNKSEISDNELILQQLEIVQQVLDFENEKGKIETLTPIKQEQSKNITDFSEMFNTETIKTLRVDSVKLDSLINQVNELTITKIKTKKRLLELNEINKEIEDNQKNLSKILNHLKYYDKKYSQIDNNENNMSFFVKQFLNLFSEDNKRIQKISQDITKLEKSIQEDDAKMDLIVDNLGNMVKNIRILPFATVFHLFGRMVRDIAQEKGKKIDFEIAGSDTCTDKKIIEEIKTPLIHIIRNSIDHGIETPEERVSMGKSPTGKILLSARQSNNKVIIEITDDGRGINLAKIKEKAISKGFLTPEELKTMTDEQITNLIFAPGFSTGDEITNISGRGIGLDVVQSKIAQLNGKVKLLSELNKGCCIQIELPTTMSILKIFLVKSGNQSFAIPIEVINTVLRKRSEEIIVNNNKKSIIFKEETVALYDLAEVLNLPHKTDENDKKTILIIENDNKIIALGVDELLGEQEVLHKKLSAPFYKLKNISGITTLISGETCLILNISNIINSASTTATSTKQIATEKITNDKFNILLVDDSATTRTLEKNILTKIGYNVELAENPIEAFEKMKTTRFDLIISDIEMPQMDGLEFLQRIKTNEMYCDIPVIIVSSLTTEETIGKIIELGAEKYIVKSEFNQETFEKTISKILRQN